VHDDGQKLGRPVVVLHASAAGNATSVLLLLSSPRYVKETRTLTFKACPFLSLPSRSMRLLLAM